MYKKIINFKGIKFYNCSFESILKKINRGGYLVAPAASALSKIESHSVYYQSLKKADVAILDSGLFCILLRFFKGYKVKKLSGYLFLKKFLKISFEKNIRFLTIDPSNIDAKFNANFLKENNIKNNYSYIAPKYNKKNIKDKKLLKKINLIKPKYILINLGGEVQEILALYIKTNIKFNVSIICTGAAIAFLTKRQAPINDMIDKFYLGWFVRLIHNPKKYFIRVASSLNLIKFFV